MALCILGDIHFTSTKPYYVEICEDFLDWFAGWDSNNSENTLILAGDIVHSSINGGVVIEYIERLYSLSLFKEIHIVVGNHDVKFRDGMDQLAYDFLRLKPGVIIYDRPADVEIQGLRCLMLPHYLPNKTEMLMNAAYSKLHEIYPEEYTLLVGHFMEESMSFGASDAIRNLEKLNVNHICLGHLHTRTNPALYIGSVYANKSNENDNTRAAITIHKDGSRTEEQLPIFAEYLNVTYPDELPASKALVPIYTIFNCPPPAVLHSKYGKVHIRKCVQSLKGSEGSTGFGDESSHLSPAEMFKEFLKVQIQPIDRRVASICLASLATETTNLGYDNRNSLEVVLQA